jgi:hypothetical protein
MVEVKECLLKNSTANSIVFFSRLYIDKMKKRLNY